MVWFQCDDCGENLKKPKLVGHFSRCSASKFSCIDCGVTFNRQSVQGHTSCITEAEKYGPKGIVKSSNAEKKDNRNGKNQTETLDLSLGLSVKPPWQCSFCHVSTTSVETLQSHSQGKKHRAKVKAATASAIKSTQDTAKDSVVPPTQENGKIPKKEEPETPTESTPEKQPEPQETKEKKNKKEKKRKSEGESDKDTNVVEEGTPKKKKKSKSVDSVQKSVESTDDKADKAEPEGAEPIGESKEEKSSRKKTKKGKDSEKEEKCNEPQEKTKEKKNKSLGAFIHDIVSKSHEGIPAKTLRKELKKAKFFPEKLGPREMKSKILQAVEQANNLVLEKKLVRAV